MLHVSSGSKGGRPPPPPTDQSFFNFMGFFRKCIKNIESAPNLRSLRPLIQQVLDPPLHVQVPLNKDLQPSNCQFFQAVPINHCISIVNKRTLKILRFDVNFAYSSSTKVIVSFLDLFSRWETSNDDIFSHHRTPLIAFGFRSPSLFTSNKYFPLDESMYMQL